MTPPEVYYLPAILHTLITSTVYSNWDEERRGEGREGGGSVRFLLLLDAKGKEKYDKRLQRSKSSRMNEIRYMEQVRI